MNEVSRDACAKCGGEVKWVETAPTFPYCRKCGTIAPQIVPKQVRPTWPATWMSIANSIALRSYDPRLRVGCITVSCDNTSVLSVGYNGGYKGGPNVPDSLEPGKSGFVHAEVNCLVKCDFNFPKRKHMYLTHSPCLPCARLIINAEIARVVYETVYRDASGIELLLSAGIETLQLQDAIHIAEAK